jgi:thiamine pyrophosphate-dependent acetolactate synthase large subunit-like protein
MPDIAESVLNRLSDRVYGYPGDGIDAFPGVCEKAGPPPFVQARHEASAVFAACPPARPAEAREHRRGGRR